RTGEELVGARPKDLQHGLVETREGPACRQPLGQQRVDFLLPGRDAADDVVEERDFGVGVVDVLDLAAEAVLVKFVEQSGEMGILHLPLIERLDSGETGGRAGLGAGGGVHSRRSSTDLAWAGSPSARASATAAGPIRRSALPSIEMKLVRFMKLRTDRPLAKRARRPVGRTWLGPAT